MSLALMYFKTNLSQHQLFEYPTGVSVIRLTAKDGQLEPLVSTITAII